jgi:hypothetical protein
MPLKQWKAAICAALCLLLVTRANASTIRYDILESTPFYGFGLSGWFVVANGDHLTTIDLYMGAAHYADITGSSVACGDVCRVYVQTYFDSAGEIHRGETGMTLLGNTLDYSGMIYRVNPWGTETPLIGSVGSGLISLNPVPLPPSIFSQLIGLALLGFLGWFRKRRAAAEHAAAAA